jgi:hypothetical protein
MSDELRQDEVVRPVIEWAIVAILPRADCETDNLISKIVSILAEEVYCRARMSSCFFARCSNVIFSCQTGVEDMLDQPV